MTYNSIVHICNNYVGTRVHGNLCLALSDIEDTRQTIFIPIRKKSHFNFNSTNNDLIQEDYVLSNKSFLKFTPLLKVIFNYFAFTSKNYKADAVIAHTAWSDGIVAYLNFLKNKTPYTISIRDTDFNVFFPKLLHYHWLIKKVLKNANKVIFINRIYLEKAKTRFPRIFSELDNLIVIPNGVDQFWLDNRFFAEYSTRKYDFIFVGKNEPRKNLKKAYEALAVYHKERPIQFCIVGLTPNEVLKLLEIDELPQWIDCIGKVNKEKLLELYRQSKILFLPSYRETFGLVYIEALSQHCGVIHAKGQAIDKMFNSSMVIATDPKNIELMYKDIKKIHESYRADNEFPDISNFDWNKIGQQYLNCFREQNEQ